MIFQVSGIMTETSMRFFWNQFTASVTCSVHGGSKPPLRGSPVCRQHLDGRHAEYNVKVSVCMLQGEILSW